MERSKREQHVNNQGGGRVSSVVPYIAHPSKYTLHPTFQPGAEKLPLGRADMLPRQPLKGALDTHPGPLSCSRTRGSRL